MSMPIAAVVRNLMSDLDVLGSSEVERLEF